MQLTTDYWSVTSVVSTTSRIVHHHIPTVVAGKLSVSCVRCCGAYLPSSRSLVLNSSANTFNMTSALLAKVLPPSPCSRLNAPASKCCRRRWTQIAWPITHIDACAVMGSGVVPLLQFFPSCSASLAGWLVCGDICRTLPLLLCRRPSIGDDLHDGIAVLTFLPCSMWSCRSQQLGSAWQALLVLSWTSAVLGRGIDRAAADDSVIDRWGINSNGDRCVTVESSLEGFGSLAWLCQLLNFEQQLLGLGAPVLGLGTCALAIGTVIDVLKSPQVWGFIAAAGWLPLGVFLLWCGISWATSGPGHVGVLGWGLSGANTGLVWFDVGAVLVAFFVVAVFIMLLTS